MVKLKPKQKEQIEKQIKAYESKTSTELIKIPIGSDELDLEVDPYVANPNIMNSGIQLVNYLFEHPELVKDKIVTDMGTGCGIIGIAAAKMGAKKVFMIDIDAKAVKNAQRNVERHKVGNICTIITSDLFKNINEDTKSHTHIFNHPFFAGEPIKGKEWTKVMLGGTEIIDRYLEQAKSYSQDDTIYLFPWLTTAENEDNEDNDPGKRASKLGFNVSKVTTQEPVSQGIQQALFKIYEIGY